MLYFRTAADNPTRQPVKPIYLNRLNENLDYLLYSHVGGLVLGTP